MNPTICRAAGSGRHQLSRVALLRLLPRPGGVRNAHRPQKAGDHTHQAQSLFDFSHIGRLMRYN